MPKRIFIGSSGEALELAQHLQLSLNNQYGGRYLAKVWNQNVIAPGQNVLSSIIEEIKSSEYGIFIFHGDDLLTKRSSQVSVVRDNVLFEFGLAVGILGLERCYIVKCSGVDIPSDFAGVQYSSYKAGLPGGDTATVMGTVANEINGAITRLDAGPGRVISWHAYCRAAGSLARQIHKSARQGGYRYDMIVGVSRGGLVAADMLGRASGARAPVVSYWADDIDEDSLSDYNSNLLGFIAGSQYSKILLVDDISRTGASMARLAQRLGESCGSIKTGALFAGRQSRHSLDFVGEVLDDDAISAMQMPYGTGLV